MTDGLSRSDRLLAGAGGALLNGLMATTRSELIGGQDVEREVVDAGLPAIYILWHGRLLLCAHRYRDRGLGTLITLNRDGDLISGMIEGWGYRVVRGSTSRGGLEASRGLLEMLRAGRSIALTPDGPRGPRASLKPGPVHLARLTGAPLIPVSAAASRYRAFGTWDRFIVPLPFAGCPAVLGEPIFVPSSATDRRMGRYVDAAERALNRCTATVDEAARA